MKSFVHGTFAVIAISAAACGTSLSTVRQQAAADMHCDDAKLTVTQPVPNGSLYYVDGCGETRRYTAVCTGGYCPHLEGQPASAMVKRQAAFDLGCEEGQVTTTYLNVDTFGARGCGRQASYSLVCQVGPCRVVQNTQTQ